MHVGRLWLAVIPMVASVSLVAQQTPEQLKIQELEKKIEDLDRRLQAAETKGNLVSATPQLAAPAAPPQAQTSTDTTLRNHGSVGTVQVQDLKSTAFVTADPTGFAIKSSDGNYLLKIGADLQAGSAINVKRYIRRDVANYFAHDAENPYWILDTVEMKTAWHPIGL